MGESTLPTPEHSVMTQSVHDHISRQGNYKAQPQVSPTNSFEKSTKIRLDVEGVDGNKGISGSYPPSVVVNINTSMTINPLTASNGNHFTHGGSPTYYNEKSVFGPGAQSSYASTTDQTKDLKREAVSSYPQVPDLTSSYTGNPHYSFQNFGQHPSFSHQPSANIPNYYQMSQTSISRETSPNLTPFNYTRNFPSPVLQVSNPTISVKNSHTDFSLKAASHSDISQNRDDLSPSEAGSFSGYSPPMQEDVGSSSTPLYTTPNVLPHYSFHSHPHYPFYSYPTATDISSLHPQIFPYCNSYQQYYLGRNADEAFYFDQPAQGDTKKVTPEKRTDFCTEEIPKTHTNRNVATDIVDASLNSNKPRKSSKCQCPNCTNRPKNISSKIVKKHACHWPNCGKTYGKTSHLKSHIRQHQGIRPFVCPTKTCMKSFTRSDELSRHVRIHTGEKRFNCASCSKGFTRSDHLKKHEKTHRGNLLKSDTEAIKPLSKAPKLDTSNTVLEDVIGKNDNQNDSFLQDQFKSVTPMKLSPKEREINDKNRSNGGVVSICDTDNKGTIVINSQGERVILPKKGRPNKKKDTIDQENQPLGQENHSYSNSSSDIMAAAFNSGLRTGNPLQEIPSYHRVDNFAGTILQEPKPEHVQSSFIPSSRSDFMSHYPTSTSTYSQPNIFSYSNTLPLGCAQNSNYRHNEC